MMKKYQELKEAREILGLPEKATRKSIKSAYRSMLAKWHPDKCTDNPERCHEMTRKIVAAYKTISDYCAQYHYSFAEEDVRDNLSPEELWHERFGDDPLWGRG